MRASSRSCARSILVRLKSLSSTTIVATTLQPSLRVRPPSAPEREVTVITSKGPARGWTGKLWALKEGISAAEALRPDYLLLTDADIVHTSDTVAWLVAHSLAGEYVLVSLMAKLRCASLAERSHVPAFIYFFQMLFPFRGSIAPSSSVAAAAGGCILVRRRMRSTGQAALPAFAIR